MDDYILSRQAGIKLDQLLKERNLTQSKAATILSVDERTIRRWIKDGIDKISILELISKKFDIDLFETFFEKVEQ